MNMTLKGKIGIDGPIKRGHYFLIFCSYIVVNFGLAFLFVAESLTLSSEAPWFSILLLLFLLFIFIEATGNRLIDAGHKPSLKWLQLVPFLGLLLTVYLFYKQSRLDELEEMKLSNNE